VAREFRVAILPVSRKIGARQSKQEKSTWRAVQKDHPTTKEQADYSVDFSIAGKKIPDYPI
jgi:hypothetical protein